MAFIGHIIVLISFLCLLNCRCFALEEDEDNDKSRQCDDHDLPLMLTPLIDKNQTDQARQLSQVDKAYLEDFVPPSHAGYFTVDKDIGSHMFFWFFPSPTNASGAPLLLWLNGGPTLSSLLGLFHENGPMAIKTKTEKRGREPEDDDDTHEPLYERRNHSWVGPFSMLYVDNPVNVGFSYSEKGKAGDSYTEEKITENLYSLLRQFLLVFPEYRDVELYIGGQSYAGTYTISLAHYIHTQMRRGRQDVIISGIYIGGPYFDPQRQMLPVGEFNYQIGLINRQVFKEYKEVLNIVFENRDKICKANISLEELFHGFFPWFHDDNLVTQEKPPYSKVHAVMNRLDMKRAVHAGRHRQFKIWNGQMWNGLACDALTSRMEKLAVLLDSVKVLIFNGDLDSVIPTASIEAALMHTPWKLQRDYNETTSRYEWGVNDENGKRFGFFSRLGQLCRVIIIGAGHQTPYDKPEVCLRVMKDFVTHGCVRIVEGGDEFVQQMDLSSKTREAVEKSGQN